MKAYKTEVTVPADGSLTLTALPFSPGERVEVIVLSTTRQPASTNPYPLRGTPYRYDNPTAPVAEADWDAAQ